MAFIHRTTMTPGKLELITGWLPKQSWYAGTGGAPDLTKGGGFRLDDPEGAVGIEFMVVVDSAGPEPVAYLVPLSYRDAALEGVPEAALIGTSEHGVIGTRWVYDGVHDPVVLDRLSALLRGEANPQHQSLSDTPTRPSPCTEPVPTRKPTFGSTASCGPVRATSRHRHTS